ncbi:MAG: thioesterase family protein [Dysgonamonadaceae bacterium]
MLKEGLTYESKTTVNEDNLACTLGSGDMKVFATPAMVALMENASMKAVADYLPEGSSTVGAAMNTTHTKPSGLGQTIHATATLIEIDRRKLTFRVVAKDEEGNIGEGTHIRFIVDREKFLSKVYQ